MSHLGIKKPWGIKSCCLSNTKHPLLYFISKYRKKANKKLQKINLKMLHTRVQFEKQNKKLCWITRKDHLRTIKGWIHKNNCLWKQEKKPGETTQNIWQLENTTLTNLEGGFSSSFYPCVHKHYLLQWNPFTISLPFAWISDAWRGDLRTKEVCLHLHDTDSSLWRVKRHNCVIRMSRMSTKN